MTETVKGFVIDLSDNNNVGRLITVAQFAKLREEGVIGVVVKATGGGVGAVPYRYKNPLYAATRDNAVAAGIKAIAYHFWQPGVDPLEQADYFMAYAGKPWARVLDYETGTETGDYAEFLNALAVPASERAGYGSLSVAAMADLPAQKWVAAYGPDGKDQPPPPEIEAQVKAAGASMWQFGSVETLPGIVGAVDESIWLGTDAQFEALFHVPAAVKSDNE